MWARCVPIVMPPPVEELRPRYLGLDAALLLRCSASPLVAGARDVEPWMERDHRGRVAVLACRGPSAALPRSHPDKGVWPRQLGTTPALLPRCSTSPLGARPRDTAL